ncbi:MAG: hypothetical protein HYW49_11705 [Deltaproteobacteria bacterium]|nr:hypothetical protein [Deltaproteobacteria bacterium]
MRKTTIYLEDNELEQLKQRAFLLNTSVANLIRKVIKSLITPASSKEEKALKALAEIRKEFTDVNPKSLMNDVIEAQRDIRNAKKTKSRR